jgi:curli biogenesis system outer membrane secretion channel CsgG
MNTLAKDALFSSVCVAVLALLGACMTNGATARNHDLAASENAYDCPASRPRVVVAGFEPGAQNVPPEIGPGLRDMLVAALTETGCYRVIDLTVLGGNDATTDLARRAGADLFVAGRVTEFEPDAPGADVGVQDGSKLADWLHSAGLQVASSRISLALRLIDADTGEVVAGSTLTGSAQDIGASVQENEFGLKLATYAKTPIGEAMRDAINQAVAFLVDRTPTQSPTYQQADLTLR